MCATGSAAVEQGASSMLIALLARGTRRRIEQAIAPTGLRPTELLVLQHLRDRGPSPQQALADLIGIDATNLVAVLNSLEDQSLIERHRDRADRRRAIIALSGQGEQALADLDNSLLDIDDVILAALTGDERETLHDLLSKAARNIGPGCAAPPGQSC